MNFIPSIRILKNENAYSECVARYVENGVKTVRCCITKEDNDFLLNSINMYNKICMEKYGYKFNILMDTSLPKDKIRLFVDNEEKNIKTNINEMITIYHKNVPNYNGIEVLSADISGCIIEKGDEIFVGDGECILTVQYVYDDRIIAKSLTNSIIKSGMSLSSKKGFITKTNTEIEKKCLDLVAKVRPEIVAFSYIEDKSDIEYCKNNIRNIDTKYTPLIMSKIETVEGMKNARDIIENSDLLMFARGCMGLNAGAEYLYYYQKKLIEICKLYNKEIYIASGIMKTLKEKNYPTRSEMCDAFSIIEMGYKNIIITDQTSQFYTLTLLIDWMKRMLRILREE